MCDVCKNECVDCCEPTGLILYLWENFMDDDQADHILDSARDHCIGFMDRGSETWMFIGEDGTLQPWLKSFGIDFPKTYYALNTVEWKTVKG